MNEYNYYKICINKDNEYSEELINFRIVSWTDKNIIKEENSKASIEYNLSSGLISLECNFNNPNKYITEDEFVAIRSDSNVNMSLLDMVYGEMTFSENIGIRTYNTYGRMKTRETFLNNVCDIINSHCGCQVSWKYITDDEDLNNQRIIDNMYSIRPWAQEGLEEFLNIYTNGCIYTGYYFDYGQYEFEDYWIKYGDKIFEMFNHVHGPTCLMWDDTRGECGYCGIDYEEVIEDGGYCAGIQEEMLHLIDICVFCGPRVLMYYGQKNNIDYKLIYDVINDYGEFYEKDKYENLIEKWNLVHNYNYVFKKLDYNVDESTTLYEKSIDELKQILKNYEMFERWDKIRKKMNSYRIHIGIVHCDDKKELDVKRDDLYITKSFDKDCQNYFEWLVTFNNEEVYDNDGGSYKYEDVINLNADIEWINIEMLENLEILYDIKPFKIKEV